jgi:hypothetical protein
MVALHAGPGEAKPLTLQPPRFCRRAGKPFYLAMAFRLKNNTKSHYLIKLNQKVVFTFLFFEITTQALLMPFLEYSAALFTKL